MHTTTGTLKASAIARCSFDMPISPAFAPTMRMTQEGAPDVSPYRVVLRYLSCPARSAISPPHQISLRHSDDMRRERERERPMNDTIFAACIDIASQLIFSWRSASMSVECEEGGRIASPEGPKPRI